MMRRLSVSNTVLLIICLMYLILSDLWTIPNLLITPHCSSDDLKEYVPMTLDLVFRNVARAMSNRGLLNKVDLKREY